MKKIDQTFPIKVIKKRTDNHSHKGNYGRILLIGGNEEMGGAIIMASKAASYAGAGLVTVASDPSNKTALYTHLPEAMFVDLYDKESLLRVLSSSEIIVIGPGLGRGKQEGLIFETVLNNKKPNQRIIIDGDAIHLFSKNDRLPSSGSFIFTPHLGEWEQLTGITPEVQNPTENQEKALALEAVIVLKGHRTEIYDGQEIYQNTTGTPAQAIGGMGDTLAGMIAGFIGQFGNATEVIAAAVYLHSAIAEKLSKDNYVVLPTKIIEQIPFMMKNYETL